MLDELLTRLRGLKGRVAQLSETFDLPKVQENIMRLEALSVESGFWDDPVAAQKHMKELSLLQKKASTQAELAERIELAQEYISLLSDEESSETPQDIINEVSHIESILDEMELAAMLNGKYDNYNAVFSLAAGAGGTDAQDWAEMLMRMYTRYFEKKGYRYQCVDLSVGEEAGIKGATFMVEGEFVYGYLKEEVGIHRLVRLSPFNANNKRQTSFAAVEVIPVVEKSTDIDINTDDLRIDTYRSSGAGGQHEKP